MEIRLEAAAGIYTLEPDETFLVDVVVLGETLAMLGQRGQRAYNMLIRSYELAARQVQHD